MRKIKKLPGSTTMNQLTEQLYSIRYNAFQVLATINLIAGIVLWFELFNTFI